VSDGNQVRETRLRLLLAKAVHDGAKPIPRRRLEGWASSSFSVSGRVAREYVDDLILRGYLSLRVGHVVPTEKAKGEVLPLER
jgi:poly(3-hydroxyalkanoate) synthetase